MIGGQSDSAGLSPAGRARAGAAVFVREFRTILRTPGYALLAAGLFVVVFAIVLVGGGGQTGHLPATVDLLLPTELLVPVVAVILGYRALLTDTQSGEFAVVRTYPVGVGTYVIGVIAARLVALLAIITAVYGAAAIYVGLTASPDTGIYATHAGVDSPLVFVRFLAFTLVLGATYLLLAAAVSTIAKSRRGAMALGALVVVLGAAADLGLVAGLAAGSIDSLAAALAVTPNSAYRGLVFEYVVGIAFGGETGYVAPGAALAGLLGWIVLGIAVSLLAMAYGRSVRDAIEGVRYRNSL